MAFAQACGLCAEMLLTHCAVRPITFANGEIYIYTTLVSDPLLLPRGVASVVGYRSTHCAVRPGGGKC